MLRRLLASSLAAVDRARSRIAFAKATRIGRDVLIAGAPHVENAGELVIGSSCAFVSMPAPIDLRVAPGATLTIGDGALLESGVSIRARGYISIGARARVGRGVIIDDEASGEGIEIGNDAWVEDGAMITAGARVRPFSRFLREDSASTSAAVGVSLGNTGREAADRNGAARRDGNSTPVQGTADLKRRTALVIARIVPAVSAAEDAIPLADIDGWSSLAALRILVALERELAVRLPQDLFASPKTLDDLAAVIEARMTAGVELR